jgi:hypothetical protein
MTSSMGWDGYVRARGEGRCGLGRRGMWRRGGVGWKREHVSTLKYSAAAS